MGNAIYKLVDGKGRVLIPKALREAANLEYGGIVGLGLADGKVTVRRVDVIEPGDQSPEAVEAYVHAALKTMPDSTNPVVRKLLEKDQVHLDRIQVQMATAREFLIMVRLREEKESEVFPYLSRIEKSLKEQGFSVKRADREDLKRILAVYYEQNVTTERFEDFDGERWIMPED